jgi:hypothetical protein
MLFECRESLLEACSDLGFEWREGQRTYEWFGRWVGDTKMPEGLTVADLGKCDHAIRVPGCSYEVGVVEVEGGYELRWDYWGQGGLLKALGGETAPVLKQAYANAKSKREASALGMNVLNETRLEDGSIELTLQEGTSW